MKIQRGKIAILLVVLVLVFPASLFAYKAMDDRAWSACTATPTAEPNFSVTKEFSWSPLGWVCHKTLTDEDGNLTGDTFDKHIPLIP